MPIWKEQRHLSVSAGAPGQPQPRCHHRDTGLLTHDLLPRAWGFRRGRFDILCRVPCAKEEGVHLCAPSKPSQEPALPQAGRQWVYEDSHFHVPPTLAIPSFTD